MVQRVVFTCVLSLALFGVLLAPAPAQDGASLQRMARTSIETPDHKSVSDFSGESAVPGWLDELLSRLPERVLNGDFDDAAEEQSQDPSTEQIGQTLEQGLEESQPPHDEGFPKPQPIPPLYVSPPLEGEGIWTADNLPVGSDGRPLAYKTVYRPSQDFPNSIVYMAMFDLSRLKTRLFIGEGEPGIYQISHNNPENLSKIVAITNAMWMQQHSRGAGAIFRGQVVYPMVEGMATLVVYRDESVDIVEWTNEIPRSLVSDARQLRHLIVKDGKVVDKVVNNSRIEDAEIGLGGFLIDNSGRSTMANRDLWFLANRSAFGIRNDGNLVFAMGHHVSTKDLARALVLAGCRSAIHGDANIHNIVCNFYFRNEADKIVKRDRLSPEQKTYTMNRYDRGYSKDFFAFYER